MCRRLPVHAPVVTSEQVTSFFFSPAELRCKDSQATDGEHFVVYFFELLVNQHHFHKHDIGLIKPSKPAPSGAGGERTVKLLL